MLRVAVILLAVTMSAFMASPTIATFLRNDIVGVDYFVIAEGLRGTLTEAYSVTDPPFAYPPTAKLFLWPMALLPTTIGYALFTAATAALLLCASRRHLARSELALILLSFPFLNAALCGQTTFLVAALMLLGLTTKDRRVAGVILAIGAAIKPQLFLFVPLYVLVNRDWDAVRWGAASMLGIVIVSIGMFGIEPWVQFPAALANYGNVIIQNGVIRWVIAPIGMAMREGWPMWPVAIPCALGALALPFLRYCDPIEALFGLTLAALLVLPFAIPYEAVGLVPLLVRRICRGKLVEVLAYSFFWPGIALLASLRTATAIAFKAYGVRLLDYFYREPRDVGFNVHRSIHVFDSDMDVEKVAR